MKTNAVSPTPMNEVFVPISVKEAWQGHHNNRIEEQCLSQYIIDRCMDDLSQQTGLNLEFIEAERFENEFRADIICKDIESDETVIIENMLGDTDHGHIGKAIAYSAIETENDDKPVNKIIFICERFRDSHIKTCRNLNRLHNFEIYGFEIHCYKDKRNGETLSQLKLVVSPEMNKQTSSTKNTRTSKNDGRYDEFFEGFISTLQEEVPIVKFHAGSPYQQIFYTQGTSGGFKRKADGTFVVECVYGKKRDNSNGKSKVRFDKICAELKAKYNNAFVEVESQSEDVERIEYNVPFNEKDVDKYAEICKAVYTAYMNSDV